MAEAFGFDNEPQNISVEGTIGTSDTAIGSASGVRINKGVEIGTFEIKNTHGTRAFNNFEVWVKPHAASDFIKLVDDFSTEDSVMLGCTVAADSLAANTSSILTIRTGPIDAILFKASVASSTGSALVRGRMN